MDDLGVPGIPISGKLGLVASPLRPRQAQGRAQREVQGRGPEGWDFSTPRVVGFGAKPILVGLKMRDGHM